MSASLRAFSEPAVQTPCPRLRERPYSRPGKPSAQPLGMLRVSPHLPGTRYRTRRSKASFARPPRNPGIACAGILGTRYPPHRPRYHRPLENTPAGGWLLHLPLTTTLGKRRNKLRVILRTLPRPICRRANASDGACAPSRSEYLPR